MFGDGWPRAWERLPSLSRRLFAVRVGCLGMVLPKVGFLVVARRAVAGCCIVGLVREEGAGL